MAVDPITAGIGLLDKFVDKFVPDKDLDNKLKAQALKNSQQLSQPQLSRKQHQEKNMPLECVKLAASLEACDQTNGFLSMGCKAMARSQFDCPIPLN